jgi:hypothetical protein
MTVVGASGGAGTRIYGPGAGGEEKRKRWQWRWNRAERNWRDWNDGRCGRDLRHRMTGAIGATGAATITAGAIPTAAGSGAALITGVTPRWNNTRYSPPSCGHAAFAPSSLTSSGAMHRGHNIVMVASLSTRLAFDDREKLKRKRQRAE